MNQELLGKLKVAKSATTVKAQQESTSDSASSTESDIITPKTTLDDIFFCDFMVDMERKKRKSIRQRRKTIRRTMKTLELNKNDVKALELNRNDASIQQLLELGKVESSKALNQMNSQASIGNLNFAPGNVSKAKLSDASLPTSLQKK